MCHYECLGLDASQRATIDPQKIRHAFLRMARMHHPDRSNRDSSEVFMRARLAYEVLSDPMRKKIYDMSLSSTMDEAWDRYGWILRRGSDVAIRLASLVPTKITWQADIELPVQVARASLGSSIHVTYKRIVHSIEGSVVGFLNETHEISVDLHPDVDYNEEFLVVKNAGNDIIENGRIYTGSLNLDIDIL